MITHNFIHVEQPDFFKSIESWLTSVSAELFPSFAEITYIYCSDEDLLALNRSALSHDYYTDIITFDLRDEPQEPLSCEIHISLERVRENATSFNCTFAEELKRVMVHGLLHLAGMNDATDTEKLAMREAENKFLKQFK